MKKSLKTYSSNILWKYANFSCSHRNSKYIFPLLFKALSTQGSEEDNNYIPKNKSENLCKKNA